MAFRALLFSKSPEPAELLGAVFNELGIRVDVCSDIFNAIEKGTRENFSCLIVDWSDQPESNFLLKRARESGGNRNALPIAIVDTDPAAAELRENRLEFLLYRPLTADEARAVLGKACQQMQVQSATLEEELARSPQQFETAETSQEPEDPNLVPIAAEASESHAGASQAEFRDPEPEEITEGDEPAIEEAEPALSRRLIGFGGFRTVCAAVLALAAVFCLWRSRETASYLAQTHEGLFRVLQESTAALLYTNHSGAQPVGSAATDAQQDAYFARTTENTHGHPALGLVSAEASLPEGLVRLPKPFDFPLPTPELLHSEPPPLHVERGPVPDSLRHAAPIGPPVVATVPAQIMPVSTPVPQIPQFSEPVHLSEEAARALLVHSVDPVYPNEAAAQKFQGPVVLQAMIGRDGSVQDLKMVRGYFVLGRAAVAAVKQWRFQPYIVNGHPAEMQTVLTVNFSHPEN